MKSKISLENNGLFHVHTSRCGHAELCPDEDYVRKAILCGYKDIWFSDHGPFPGDPFYARMKFNELDNYLTSTTELKNKYDGQITIHCGLEIEYFLKYESYYQKLIDEERLDFLLLGQHMGVRPNGKYTFNYNSNLETPYIIDGIENGVLTGYFDAVAHPDRAFRHNTSFSSEDVQLRNELISLLKQLQIPVEKNSASYRDYSLAYRFFWDNDAELNVIFGADAHSISDIDLFKTAI